MKYKTADADCDWSQERVIQSPSAASIAELLKVLLSVPLERAEAIAERLTGQSNLFDKNSAWAMFKSLSQHDLTAAGLTKTQATRLLAAMELGKRVFLAPPAQQQTIVDDPRVAASLFNYDLAASPVEKFAVLILNIKHAVIAQEILSIGSKTETVVSPSEIFEKVFRYRGVRFIIAHCHPSGNTEPSAEDLQVTKQLLSIAKQLCVPMLDHLIIGSGFTSLRQVTNLWKEIPQGD